jgi:hypothetical protein
VKKIKTSQLSLVDESEIDFYPFTYVAVKMVMWFKNGDLLKDIDKIGNLGSGPYGIYDPKENQRILPPEIRDSILMVMQQQGLDEQAIAHIPEFTLKRMFPDMANYQLEKHDTIRVNISREIAESNGDDWWAVKEIGSTIVHEATHQKELEETGTTSEAGPQAAESEFATWAESSKEQVMAMFPDLKQAHEQEVMQLQNNQVVNQEQMEEVGIAAYKIDRKDLNKKSWVRIK